MVLGVFRAVLVPVVVVVDLEGLVGAVVQHEAALGGPVALLRLWGRGLPRARRGLVCARLVRLVLLVVLLVELETWEEC